jgi:hypothetical protein
MIDRLISFFLILCLDITQTAQAYSLVRLPYQPRQQHQSGNGDYTETSQPGRVGKPHLPTRNKKIASPHISPKKYARQ